MTTEAMIRVTQSDQRVGRSAGIPGWAYRDADTFAGPPTRGAWLLALDDVEFVEKWLATTAEHKSDLHEDERFRCKRWYVQVTGVGQGLEGLHLVGLSQEGFDAVPGEMAKPKIAEDFYAYLPQHQYIFRPTRELWRPESVNAVVPPVRVGREVIPANRWLDQNRAVEQVSWMPGKPEIIENVVIDLGGVIPRPGLRVFNLYRAPAIIDGDARMAGRWLDLLHTIWPQEANHMERWFAQRIQNPSVKVNHALVAAGPPGIGKDTVLEPIKVNVGAWNWQEISPTMLMGRFTGWAKAVVVRVSEVRDLGDVDRYAFHEHTKVFAAAPPDALRVDEKNLREHYVPNVLGLIMTTNHALTGLYLPADDRRHFVAASKVKKEFFDAEFFASLWHWYEHGGNGHVGDYLRNLDLSGFDPKAPPPRTEAFEQLVQANSAPEESELADLIETMGYPYAITLPMIRDAATARSRYELVAFLNDRSTQRQIPHRLSDCGYDFIKNPGRADGKWPIGDRKLVVYARRELALRDQIIAARGIA